MSKILVFVGEEFEDSELFDPVKAAQQAGHEVTFAGAKVQEYKGKKGGSQKTDISFKDVDGKAFDALLIPGGYAPDKIRVEKEALEILKEMDEAQKPIGMICHAGQVAVSADVLKGRKVTSVANIKDDMVNAGAHWVDEEAVVDKNFVTSRTPKDLPAYNEAFLKLLKDK